MPGLDSSSALTSDPISVTAREIFFLIEDGSSSKSTIPCGVEDDLLILTEGSCRSVILATSRTMYGPGTTNVLPNLWLNGCARALVSSRGWRWTPPTGPWLVWYSSLAAACRIGYVNRPTLA